MPSDAAKVDHGLRFARIARAVRQTLALEEKFEAERRERREAAEAERAAELGERGLRRKNRASNIVERMLDDFPEAEAERLSDSLHERLADAEDADFADRPLGEIVAAICRDLGVTIDWSLWEDETWGLEAAAAEGAAERAAEPSTADALGPPAAPPDEPALVLSG